MRELTFTDENNKTKDSVKFKKLQSYDHESSSDDVFEITDEVLKRRHDLNAYIMSSDAHTKMMIQ